MDRNTAGVLVALITAAGGLGTAAISLKATLAKTDMEVTKAGYTALETRVNKIATAVEQIHDKVYGISHSAGGEAEDGGLPSESCPPYDAEVAPVPTPGTSVPAPTPGTGSSAPTPYPLPPPAPPPPSGEGPLHLDRVPTFQQMMQQNGF